MESFDPLYEWLGIPPKDQPPNHYRLLGIELFEVRTSVIERAADRQMAHVRTFQQGRHLKQSQELLNLLAAAKLCLLDPVRRAAYDQSLRAALLPPNVPPAVPPALVAPSPPLMVPSAIPLSRAASPGIAEPPAPSPKIAAPSRFRRTVRRKSVWAHPGIWLLIAVTLGALALFVILSTLQDTSREAQAPADRQASVETVNPTTESISPTTKTAVPKTNAVAPEATTAAPVSETEPAEYPDDAIRSLGAGDQQSRWAYCLTLPLGAFPKVEQQLADDGYRPLRLRPYLAGNRVRLAATWWRDSRTGLAIGPLAMSEIREQQEALFADGWQVIDASGYYWEGQEKYFAVFLRPADDDGDDAPANRVLLGSTTDQFRQQFQELTPSGYLLTSRQQFVAGQDGVRVNAVWAKITDDQESSTFTGPWSYYEQQQKKEGDAFVDLTLFRLAKGNVVYLGSIVRSSRQPTTVVIETSIESHRARVAELTAMDWIPVTVSVQGGAEGERTTICSVWQPPST